MVKIGSYRVHELGGTFVVIGYDGRGRPVQGHPLGNTMFPTRDAAELALQRFLARASAFERGSE